MSTQEWATTSRSTTHGVNYTIRRKPMQYRASELRVGQRCALLECSLEDNMPFVIGCFGCGCFSGRDEYFRYHRQLFLVRLLNHHPSIQSCCADVIAGSFLWILQWATMNHRCTVLDNVPSSVVHILNFHIQLSTLMESFEEAGPTMTPACRDFVDSLVTQKVEEEREEGDLFEYGWTDNSHECVICFDEIQTRKSSLNMPCSHVFHEDCLVMWLNNSHFCPLCRYELPSQDFNFSDEEEEDDSNFLESLN